jgi:hypothetical protein
VNLRFIAPWEPSPRVRGYPKRALRVSYDSIFTMPARVCSAPTCNRSLTATADGKCTHCLEHCSDAQCSAVYHRLHHAKAQPDAQPQVVTCSAKGAAASSCKPPFGANNACCPNHCTTDTCAIQGHTSAYIARLREAAVPPQVAPQGAGLGGGGSSSTGVQPSGLPPKVCKLATIGERTCTAPFTDDDACCTTHCRNEECTSASHVTAQLRRNRTRPQEDDGSRPPKRQQCRGGSDGTGQARSFFAQGPLGTAESPEARHYRDLQEFEKIWTDGSDRCKRAWSYVRASVFGAIALVIFNAIALPTVGTKPSLLIEYLFSPALETAASARLPTGDPSTADTFDTSAMSTAASGIRSRLVLGATAMRDILVGWALRRKADKDPSKWGLVVKGWDSARPGFLHVVLATLKEDELTEDGSSDLPEVQISSPMYALWWYITFVILPYLTRITRFQALWDAHEKKLMQDHKEDLCSLPAYKADANNGNTAAALSTILRNFRGGGGAGGGGRDSNRGGRDRDRNKRDKARGNGATTEAQPSHTTATTSNTTATASGNRGGGGGRGGSGGNRGGGGDKGGRGGGGRGGGRDGRGSGGASTTTVPE